MDKESGNENLLTKGESSAVLRNSLVTKLDASKRKRVRDSSEDSDTSDSSPPRHKKRKKTKKSKRKKSKKKKKLKRKKCKSSDSSDTDECRVKKSKKKSKIESAPIKDVEECDQFGPAIPEEILRSSIKAPMSKEQWEKQQSVVRRVFDEDSGRYRLIKGDGEVLEECVSRDQHRLINKQATAADGAYFQKQLSRK